MKHVFAMTTFVMSLGLVGGCSTPPVVTETADHTAVMMGQLQAETARFQKARLASNESVLEAVKGLQMRVAQQRANLNESLRADEAAGNVERVQLFGRLKALSDGLKQDDADLEALSEKTNAELAALLKPLPNTPAKLAAAAGSVAAVGQDLSSKDQVEETVKLLQGVWASAKENRDKLQKATAP